VKTSKLAPWVTGLTVAAFATGCSSGGTTPQDSGSSAAAEAVTITFQEQFSDSESAQMEKQLADFNKLHPEITVNLVRDNDSSYYDKLATQVVAGKGPDIARVEPPKAAQYIASGWVAPLGDAAGSTDDYFAASLDSVTKDGELYGVPQDLSALALYYRTDMFEAAGISAAPTTWDEFSADAKMLTKDGQYGVGLFGGWGAFEFYPWLWQAGGDVLNTDQTEAVYNSPEGVKALQLWVDLQATAMPDGMATATEDDLKARFISGNLAMLTSGPWTISSMKDAGIDGKWAIAPLPKGDQSATVLGGMDVIVMNNSKQQEAAKTFVSWLMSNEVQKEWSSALGFIPVKVALYDDPQFKSDPYVSAFAAILKDARSRPTVAAAGDVDSALGEAVQAALSGVSSPQAALDAATAKADEALSK